MGADTREQRRPGRLAASQAICQTRRDQDLDVRARSEPSFATRIIQERRERIVANLGTLDAPPILDEKVGLVRLWRVGREGHTHRTVSEQLCHLSEGSHPERHSIAHRAIVRPGVSKNGPHDPQ